MATRIALFFLSLVLVAATAGASQAISAQTRDQIVVAQSDQKTQTETTQTDQSAQSPDAKKNKKKGKKKSGGAGEDEEPECD